MNCYTTEWFILDKKYIFKLNYHYNKNDFINIFSKLVLGWKLGIHVVWQCKSFHSKICTLQTTFWLNPTNKIVYFSFYNASLMWLKRKGAYLSRATGVIPQFLGGVCVFRFLLCYFALFIVQCFVSNVVSGLSILSCPFGFL